MNMKTTKLLYLAVAIFLFHDLSYAQDKNKCDCTRLEGIVLNAATNMPEPYAAIYLYPQKATAVSDTTGRFRMENISCETSLIVVRMIGFHEYKRVLYPKDFTRELIIKATSKLKKTDTNVHPIIRRKIH